ncbi:MAG: hypothetical protein ABI124_08175 [Terrimesophilobacter sp.]
MRWMDDRRTVRLRWSQLAMSLLLMVQYLLGMVINLFVTVPTAHPGAQPAEYFTGSAQSVAWAITDGGLWLRLHASLGLLLVLAAIWTIVASVRARRARTLMILGGIFVLGAGFNGASFLNYDEGFSSMLMGGLMALAMACYVVGLFLAAPKQPAAMAAD